MDCKNVYNFKKGPHRMEKESGQVCKENTIFSVFTIIPVTCRLCIACYKIFNGRPTYSIKIIVRLSGIIPIKVSDKTVPLYVLCPVPYRIDYSSDFISARYFIYIFPIHIGARYVQHDF